MSSLQKIKRAQKSTIKGSSMFPILREGDKIHFESINQINHQLLGEIIVHFDKENNEFIAHRLVSTDPLMTEGDNSFCQETIVEESILGIVTHIERDQKVSPTPNKKWLNPLSKLKRKNHFFRRLNLLFNFFLARI